MSELCYQSNLWFRATFLNQPIAKNRCPLYCMVKDGGGEEGGGGGGGSAIEREAWPGGRTDFVASFAPFLHSLPHPYFQNSTLGANALEEA